MRQRKFTFLLMALLVAFGLLFAGGEAGAAISYTLTTSPPTSSSTFVSDATYHYTLIKNAGSQDISYALFEIPVAIDITNPSNYSVTSTGATVCSREVIAPGVGDAGSKFGYGDMRYRLLKLGICAPASTLVIDLTFRGSIGTDSIFGSDPQGAFEIKPSQGTVQNFLTVTPLVVPKPVTPPPAIDFFTANYNQLVLGQSLTLSWNSTGTGTITWTIRASLNGESPTSVGTGTGASGSLGPLTPPIGTTVYTLTVSNGSPSTQQETVIVSALPGAPAVTLTANPDQLVSGQKPLCANLHWDAAAGSTVAISSVTAPSVVVVPVASGLGPTGDMSVCPESTTVYTATASNAGGNNDCTATVTVNEPVIQTSCTQIIKRPKPNADGSPNPPSCLNVCFEIGGEKNLMSAELFADATCGGTGVPQAIFGPDVPDTALRVPALHCNPCEVTPTLTVLNSAGAPVLPQTLACSGIPYTTTGQNPPFDIATGDASGNYRVRCDQIVKAYEPSGYTLDLGVDPTYWNGTRWVTYSCPPGYRDTGTKCVTP